MLEQQESGESLRDALQKLAEKWAHLDAPGLSAPSNQEWATGVDQGYSNAAAELLATLDDHPVEPAAPLLDPRPMPTREQIEDALGAATGHVSEMDQHEEGEWENGCAACAGWGFPCATLSAATDAVLALLNGADS